MSPKHEYIPRFEIDVEEGTRTFREGGVVSDIVVETSVEGADRFSFTLNYEFDHASGEFDGMSWALFSPNTTVKIKLGYGGGELSTVCVGRIKEVAPDFPSTGVPSIAVSGYGLTYEMTQKPHSNSWGGETGMTSIEEIVYELNTRGGYFATSDLDVDCDVVFKGETMQDNETDYRFLTDLGEQYGHEVFGTRGTLVFRPLTARLRSPSLTLDYERDLQSFSPQVDPAKRIGVVVVTNWEQSRMEPIFGVAVSKSVESMPARVESIKNIRGMLENAEIKYEVLRRPVRSYAEAELVAASQLQLRASGYISGSGQTRGNTAVRAGEVVRITGVTERFSDDYYVTSATHRVGSSGFQTSFEVAKQAEIEGLPG